MARCPKTFRSLPGIRFPGRQAARSNAARSSRCLLMLARRSRLFPCRPVKQRAILRFLLRARNKKQFSLACCRPVPRYGADW